MLLSPARQMQQTEWSSLYPVSICLLLWCQGIYFCLLALRTKICSVLFLWNSFPKPDKLPSAPDSKVSGYNSWDSVPLTKRRILRLAVTAVTCLSGLFPPRFYPNLHSYWHRLSYGKKILQYFFFSPIACILFATVYIAYNSLWKDCY